MKLNRSSLPIGVVALLAIGGLAAQQPQYSPTPPIIPIPPGTTFTKAKALAIAAPRPKYPEYARKRHWVGVGWFVMNIDAKTGVVTSVDIQQSTGHLMLDQCAVDALRQWRFKPGTVSKVKTPITFTMARQKSRD